MSEREPQEREHEADEGGSEAARPAQAAALHDEGAQGDETPQDGTDDPRIDTDQHSDAPGPTGTG